MNAMADWLSLLGDLLPMVLVMLGTGFFLAGTAGLLRFPDTFTRLHALTKADNVGLGLIVFGLVWQTGAFTVAFKLLLIWLLALLASTVSCQLIARYLLHDGSTARRPRQ